jgi:succinyl-CoA synthetase alpha subunit
MPHRCWNMARSFGIDYLVAGVTPGKGGTHYAGNEKDRFIREVPVYNTVREAVAAQRGKYLYHLCASTVCRRCHHGSG